MPLAIFAPLFVVIVGLAIGMAMIAFLKTEEDKRFLFKIFVCGLLLRVFAAFLLYISSLGWKYHPGFFIDDGWGYNMNGWRIAVRLQRGLSVAPKIMKPGSWSGTLSTYDYINGVVYSIVDQSPLTMFFLNCVIGTLTLIFIYLIVLLVFDKLVFDKKIAKLATLLCAFWPSLFLWSTQNLKEPLTIFLIVLCFWSVISFLKKFNPFYLITFSVLLFCLGKLRETISPIVTISVVLHLVFLGYRLSYKLVRRYSAFALLCVIPLSLFIFIKLSNNNDGGFSNLFRNYQFIVSDILHDIDYFRSVRAYANLAILPNYRITNLGAFLGYLPVGLLAVLFGPFPWQLFSPAQIFALPEMLVWYLAFPYLIRGLLFGIKNRLEYLFSMFVFIICVLLILASVEGNIGTIFRHRAIITEFFLIFMAVGIVTSKKGHIGTPLQNRLK